jgi:type IV secretory pathway VirB9-like protein
MQDTIAGVTTVSQYKPKIDMDKFPVVNTRPKTSMVRMGPCRDLNTLTVMASQRRQEMVLDGLDGNEDFWDMAPSDDEDPTGNSSLGHSGERDDLCLLANPRSF